MVTKDHVCKMGEICQWAGHLLLGHLLEVNIAIDRTDASPEQIPKGSCAVAIVSSRRSIVRKDARKGPLPSRAMIEKIIPRLLSSSRAVR